MSKREELLYSAIELFGTHGFHAVGIEKVLKHAHVAKMTLYHHFASKDDLVVSCLQRVDEEIINDLRRSLKHVTGGARESLVLLMRQYPSVMSKKFKLRGCFFSRAIQEYGLIHKEVGRPILEHRKKLKDLLLECLSRGQSTLNKREQKELLSQLHLILDGLMVSTLYQESGELFELLENSVSYLLREKA